MCGFHVSPKVYKKQFGIAQLLFECLVRELAATGLASSVCVESPPPDATSRSCRTLPGPRSSAQVSICDDTPARSSAHAYAAGSSKSAVPLSARDLRHCRAEQTLARIVDLAILLHLSRSHIAITLQRRSPIGTCRICGFWRARPAEPRLLTFARRLHALANLRRGLTRSCPRDRRTFFANGPSGSLRAVQPGTCVLVLSACRAHR